MDCSCLPATLDWNALWQEGRKQRSWQGKSVAEWNKRSAGFSRQPEHHPFSRALIERIMPSATHSVLDIGAGPGTLSLPLARQVRKVTAVDFSADMLGILKERAGAAGLTNIAAIECSWEDDWEKAGITAHDIVLVSRALNVDELKEALNRVDKLARQRVVICERVGCGPFDPLIFEAVGRRFNPGPDYIYVVNMLYQMGIRATVDFFEIDSPRVYASPQAALESCLWMLGELDEKERQDLDSHLKDRLQMAGDGTCCLAGQQRPKWAVIRWEK